MNGTALWGRVAVSSRANEPADLRRLRGPGRPAPHCAITIFMMFHVGAIRALAARDRSHDCR